jgi:hypothetical protein
MGLNCSIVPLFFPHSKQYARAKAVRFLLTVLRSRTEVQPTYKYTKIRVFTTFHKKRVLLNRKVRLDL